MHLTELGFTQEEFQQRVVERICDRLLNTYASDDYGDEWLNESGLKKELDKKIQARIDETLSRLAEEHVLPKVSELVENITLQATNKWGEKKGKPLTFVEYLVQRAEEYLLEKVDFSGKGKGESSSYSWSGTQTRITFLVHQHLQYSIEQAMKSALQTANSAIASGIAETCKLKLAEVSKSLNVQVKTK